MPTIKKDTERVSERYAHIARDNAMPNYGCTHRCAGRTCTGCRTGNPCPACIARKTARLADRNGRHTGIASSAAFTLIELLIVIGLLGAMAVLVLPRIGADRGAALDQALAPSEMMDIRRAFAAFEADCVPTADDRILIGQYGLEILMRHENRGWSFPASFDPARGRGWRGPYLEAQGTRTVDVSANGQPLNSSGTTIPVVHDPRYARHAAHADERYYRVLHEPTSGHLALVYLGAGDSLTATTNSAATATTPFYDAFINHHQTEGYGFTNMIQPLGVR